MTFCSNCGEPAANENAAVCSNCGKPLETNETFRRYETDQQKNASQEYGYQRNESQEYGYQRNESQKMDAEKGLQYADNETRENSRPVKQKSPFLALVLSFFFVGLGQLYNGNIKKVIIFDACFLIGSALVFLLGLIFGLPILFGLMIVWIIGVWDAHNDAEKMNRGMIPFDKPTTLEVIGFAAFWILVVVIAVVILLVVIGVLMSLGF
jgi:ribosomal protein L37E